MKGKIALFSVALLFVALIGIVTFSTPVVAGSTITVDGDPSDWTGTPGSVNTYVVSAGEGIWTDAHNDDTGNGSYVYANGTHDDINDSMGRKSDGHAFIYTGWPNGGALDLTEFRVTADGSNLYLMFRIYNMGNTEISTKWGGGAYGFGKINIQVAIDTDRDGTGRTDLNETDNKANFLVKSWQAWEALVTIQGANPRVELEDGSITALDSTKVQGDADIYPACIEVAVPISLIGDPAGNTWRFAVFVGAEDGGGYRQVWSTAAAAGFMHYFRGWGGEGADYDLTFNQTGNNETYTYWNSTAQGNDPNCYDLAFARTQAIQEAEIGGFSSKAEINVYQDIKFGGSGNVKMPLRIIDGNPSDWTGTPGDTSTFVTSNDEAIWTDLHNDDTGNGTYVYPNGTHTDIPDSAGAPDGNAYCYTGWPNGGVVDLTELRIIADSDNLYLMFQVYNMGNKEIAEKWGAEYGFNYLMIQVAIDTDRDGTGRTDMLYQANFNVTSDCAWETLISIAPDTGRDFPNVVLEDGTRYNLTNVNVKGDGDLNTIEAAIPTSMIGDPAGQIWRFSVFVGGYDEGHYRHVCNTTWLKVTWGGFFQYFRFAGGDAEWGPNDCPMCVDLAFNPDQASQEAEIGDFSSIASIGMWRDVSFSGTGGASAVGGEAGAWNLLVMAPWIILALAIVAATVSVVLYSKKRTVKVL